MGLMDMFAQYANRPNEAAGNFDQVARQLPPEQLGQGLSHAFRADQTPPFGDMVSQLFGNSNPSQRAGVLNQLLSIVGPGVLSRVAGGALGRERQDSNASSTPDITPDDAERISPEQVREIAAEAEKKDPGVMDRIGGFYAQHPDVVKALGGTALALMLGHIAGNRNANVR